MTSNRNKIPQAFRPVPRTGVIYVITEAAKYGYHPDHPEWFNLGQGAPETDEIPGSPSRVTSIELGANDREYAPVDGLPELREAVAELYNSRYRQDKTSKYTKENVAISAGGRLALTRLVSTLGHTNIGHFLPDYTAYEELLDAVGRFVPIPVLLDPARQYNFTASEFRNEILGRGLGAALLSNPCNPTGKLLSGESLQEWVSIARELGCTLILDEFYSHYVYAEDSPSVSAAKFVDDVNNDPLVIIDGLTKNWRYPGWRLCWTVGPKSVIQGLSSAASFLDGGCARPIQRASINLVSQQIADQEAHSIQKHFRKKRQLMLENLSAMGIVVDPPPAGGFYCWGDLNRLPKGLNTGMDFFRKALEVGVITVPGQFFDINPGQRRPERPSRFQNYARFSFGPATESLERGLDQLKKLLY